MAEIPYTVRLAPKLLQRIEETARDRGIATRKLIRIVLAEHFETNRPAEHQDRSESSQHPTFRFSSM